jgi:hypothetical protein
VILVAKFELVIVETGFSSIKDIKLQILASGLPDATKNFLTIIFTWHPESVKP